MIRRILITLSLVFLVSSTAFAEEHGDDDGHRYSLPTEAMNWVDFNYSSEEREQYYSQHGVHAPGPPIVAIIFNFALLLLVLYFIARKPLSAFLKQRSENVREQLAEATRMLEEANEQLTKYNSRLERMDEEMTKLREEFIAQGEAEKDRLIEEAGAKAQRMRVDAETRLKQEFAQLREDLRVETIGKAVAAATETLRKEVKDADQRRLADEYLTKIDREGMGQ